MDRFKILKGVKPPPPRKKVSHTICPQILGQEKFLYMGQEWEGKVISATSIEINIDRNLFKFIATESKVHLGLTQKDRTYNFIIEGVRTGSIFNYMKVLREMVLVTLEGHFIQIGGDL
jgi:hypothetical protein